MPLHVDLISKRNGTSANERAALQNPRLRLVESRAIILNKVNVECAGNFGTWPQGGICSLFSEVQIDSNLSFFSRVVVSREKKRDLSN